VLTDEQQLQYYNNVIKPLYEQDCPNQLLFSFLYKNSIIGYGGLVHIDWESKRAEISFLLETSRNADAVVFQQDFEGYLSLIKQVAFDELELKKINTEAYDIRDYLYPPLEKSGFVEEARLKAHNFINGKWRDTVFHSFFARQYSRKHEKFYNVLVTSISNKAGMLQAVRSALNRLGRKSRLYGGDIDSKSIGRYFVDVFWKMPLLSTDAIPVIVDYCIKNEIRLIIPSRDGELLFWSANLAEFAKHGIFIMISNQDAVGNVIDKYNFYQKGKEWSCPVIPAVTDINLLDAETYVVKERFGAGSKKIGLNLPFDAAVKHAATLSMPVFQPYISGIEYSIDVYIAKDGKVKGAVCRSRDQVVNGESQITKTVIKPGLESICSAFAEKLGLSGHVIFQAIEDAGHNYHLIECNARFGGASTLSIAVGLDSFYWCFKEWLEDGLEEETFFNNGIQVVQVRHAADSIFYDRNSSHGN